jgi:hypothetical protein
MDKGRDESQANQENDNAIHSTATQPELSEPRKPEVIETEPHVHLETGKTANDHKNISLVPLSGTVGEAAADIPYSVFTVSQKKMIIVTGSLASLFSPMSSSIYYPSLSQIAKDLDISEAKVSLTITIFLVYISPIQHRCRS